MFRLRKLLKEMYRQHYIELYTFVEYILQYNKQDPSICSLMCCRLYKNYHLALKKNMSKCDVVLALMLLIYPLKLLNVICIKIILVFLNGFFICYNFNLFCYRALLFFELVFQEIIACLKLNNHDSGMKKIFSVAYEGSVKKYHNWVTQQIFTVSVIVFSLDIAHNVV